MKLGGGSGSVVDSSQRSAYHKSNQSITSRTSGYNGGQPSNRSGERQMSGHFRRMVLGRIGIAFSMVVRMGCFLSWCRLGGGSTSVTHVRSRRSATLSRMSPGWLTTLFPSFRLMQPVPAPQPAPPLPLPQDHNGNVLGQPRPALQQSASVRESGVRISSISHRRDHSPIILLSLATSFYLSHE